MLSIFRTNQLLASFLLLIYAALLHTGPWFVPTVWEPTGYGIAYHWLYESIKGNPLLELSATCVTLFIGGLIINYADLTFRLSREINMLPGLFFVLVSSTLPEFQQFSPLHLANVFLMIGVIQMMDTFKKNFCADALFNAGFFVSIASFFCPAYLIFLLLIFIGLNLLRGFDFRERLMVFSGAMVPYVLMGTYALWTNQINLFFKLQLMGGIKFFHFQTPLPSFIQLIPFSILVIFLLIIVRNQGNFMGKQVIQSQKRINILYWFVLLSPLTLIFQSDIQLDHALALAVPFGFLLGMFFSSIPGNWAELTHLVWLAYLLFFQYKDLIFKA